MENTELEKLAHHTRALMTYVQEIKDEMSITLAFLGRILGNLGKAHELVSQEHSDPAAILKQYLSSGIDLSVMFEDFREYPEDNEMFKGIVSSYSEISAVLQNHRVDNWAKLLKSFVPDTIGVQNENCN